MKKSNITLLLSMVLTLLSVNAMAYSLEMQLRAKNYYSKKFGFIPENQLFYPSYIVQKSEKSITEFEFNEVVSRLKDLYAPLIDKQGARLEILGDWEDATVNAVSTREQKNWFVHVSGGIARAPKMTKDALTLVVCHEIGHHLGGAPRMALYNGWPSAEGQADYFSTSKCLKKYYSKFRHEGEVLNLPEKVKLQCLEIYKTTEERDICLKSISAAVKFGQFLDTLNPKKSPISFETPDTRQVKGTNINDYPRPQCRFDTLYAGALCSISHSELNSPDDQSFANCTDQNQVGTRPRCWFRPQ